MKNQLIFWSGVVIVTCTVLSYLLYFRDLKSHDHAPGEVCASEKADAHLHAEGDGHDHGKDPAHDHAKENDHDHAAEVAAKSAADHKHVESDGHDHGKDPAHDHAKEKDHDHAAESGDSHEEEAPPIVLTEAQRKLIQLKIAEAQPGSLDLVLRLDGEIRFDQDKVAKIMPRLPGSVNRIAVREGDQVKQGQVLASLQSPKLAELYSDYSSAKELEELGKAEHEMLATLREKKAVSEREYLKIKREFADAGIARRRAEQILISLGFDPEHNEHGHARETGSKDPVCTYYEMTAPFDGTVTARDIQLGENFTEDNERVVFVVADSSRMWLDLRARQEDLPKLHIGQAVTAEIGAGYAPVSGKIVYIAPQLDETTRTTLVRVLLDNSDRKLKSGLFAAGLVQLRKQDAGVVIPRDAVQLIDGETVVFVPHGDGFEPKVVKTGRSDGKRIEIVSGLENGGKYVADGAFELKSVLLTSGMDAHAGHGH